MTYAWTEGRIPAIRVVPRHVPLRDRLAAWWRCGVERHTYRPLHNYDAIACARCDHWITGMEMVRCRWCRRRWQASRCSGT